MRKLFVLLMWVSFALVSFAGDAEPSEQPQYIGAPDAAHMVNNRAVTMVPSLAASPGGRLWATWYAGVTPGEDQNNYVVLATSGDEGNSWEEVLVVDPDLSGPLRAFDPELWYAPDGHLYWTWAQTRGHEGGIAGVWAMKITNPEEGQPVYELPVRWTDGIMMCKPIVLSSGEWVLPVSTWRNTDSSARMVVSVDEGQSWAVRGAAHVPVEDRGYDEHMFIERKDGSLWLLCRTNYGIGESVSYDRGKTWTVVTRTELVHPSSRFFIHRLLSGSLLLVKHGDIDENVGRTQIKAFISTDDGRTWQGGLMLDERKSLSYPDGQQAADGTIYITYDRSRTHAREILLSNFREEDVIAGKDVSGDVRLIQIISKGSGGNQPGDVEVLELSNNDDGVALSLRQAGALTEASYRRASLAIGELIFTDRGYVVKDVPADLNGFSFLQVPIAGDKKYICSAEGMIYFLTPQPNRNGQGQEAGLLEQGFEKVALPEVELFSSAAKRSAQACTLYQKYCEQGEEIHLRAWAVPVLGASSR
ncbi:sialidase family protein [Coraliomargarita sp. W4R72]